jgi:hypothetical protein
MVDDFLEENEEYMDHKVVLDKPEPHFKTGHFMNYLDPSANTHALSDGSDHG